ncbi:MAG: cupin domain-containing protein [Syntrophomonadaceae bacterium]|nr:cupin domain-containing protein [Syntrophomonadaceae bacterium]
MSKNENLWTLGHKLNNFRLKKGYTLQEVADALGITASFLSMVENGRSGIGFSKLQKLLAFYGLTLADLADKEDQHGRVVKLSQAAVLGYEIEGVEARLLVDRRNNYNIEPIYFRVQPGASIGYMQHQGEEFGFVVEGMFEVSLIDLETGNEEKYILEKGDTIYYPSTVQHKWTNVFSKISIFLAAVTPPTF